MGATTWEYFAPFARDIEAALKRLRKKTFREGKYARMIPPGATLFKDAHGAADIKTIEQHIRKKAGESYFQWILRVQDALNRRLEAQSKHGKGKRPGSIEELLSEQGQNGTHSILDIGQVSPTRKFKAVSPMPPSRLWELFGTDKPTRKMVESKLGTMELLKDPMISEQWQGVYFTVYHDGHPDEICFMGTSGD